MLTKNIFQELYLIKKRALVALKFIIALSAISIVLYHIPLSKIYALLHEIDIIFLILAFLLFNVSKIISSFRLNRYFRHCGLQLNELLACKLYYLGMFYNTFLPGGIGGDGYKIYLLQKYYQTDWKRLTQATILDRLSGLAALGIFALIFSLLGTIHTLWGGISLWIIIGLIIALPCLWFFHKYLFDFFLPLFLQGTLWGVFVQFFQILCAVSILYSLHMSNAIYDWLALFLISSVVAVLPLSFGGIGTREVTFLVGSTLLALNSTVAVTISLVFYFITLLSSLSGVIFLNIFEERKEEEEEEKI